MKKYLLLLLLFTLPAAYGLEDSYYTARQLTMDMRISGGMEVIPTSGSYSVKDLTVNLSFVPKRDYRQQLISISPTPADDGNVYFYWKSPAAGQLDFNIASRIRAQREIFQVSDKAKFPIDEVPAELVSYTEASKNIDINDEIKEKANELARGEDDLYVVASKLAEYVAESTEYDLAYSTGVYKASWVFENKKGTCDEFAALFIAMARSLYIPSRYVGGVAYTNVASGKSFGPHAWAEVYFPAVGWVPFDPTYRESGYLDASHIALRYSVDSNESSTKYEWLGRNVEIEAEETKTSVSVYAEDKLDEPFLSFTSEPLVSSIGFGSYDIIITHLNNEHSYYVPLYLRISETKGVTYEAKSQYVVLKPHESKDVYWIVRIEEELDPNYEYSFPVTVYAPDYESKTSFTAKRNEPVVTGEEVTAFRDTDVREEVAEAKLSCEPEKEYYTYEDIFISCKVRNTGNAPIDGLKICAGDCVEYNLGIGDEVSFRFEKKPKQGLNNIRVTMRADGIDETVVVPVYVDEPPRIDIAELSYPREIGFNKEFNISFAAVLNGSAKAYSPLVGLSFNRRSKTFLVQDEHATYSFTLNSGELPIETEFTVNASWLDNNNRSYYTQKSFTVELANLSLLDRVLIALNGIGVWITGLF